MEPRGSIPPRRTTMDLSMEIADSLWKIDKSLGYEYVHLPSHPWANKAGKVYRHIYVACMRLGRYLKEDEHVHHIDFNKLNNRPENLLVCTNTAHAQIHFFYGANWKVLDHPNWITVTCAHCGKTFKCLRSHAQKYCSYSCYYAAQRKASFTKEQLEKLIWKIPTKRLAKYFGISDTALSKWCKKWNLTKPPRGYWSKIVAKSYSI